MKTNKRFEVLKDFDYSVLDNPEYREDAVREEIIFPIINALGYSSSGNNSIVRSRKLKHPYVSIGSQQRCINIIPDYIMEVGGKPAWIMEAKSPNQDILNTKHVEQAYSYAIHSEVRAKYYTLCNGKELLVYSIDKYEPIVHCKIPELSYHWNKLQELLSPENIFRNNSSKIYKDFGLHLKRLGFEDNIGLNFYSVPINFIAKLNNNLYTFTTNIEFENDIYCASFDFSYSVFLKLEGKIPQEAFSLLKKPLSNSINEVQFGDCMFFVSVECNLDSDIEENNNEIYLPLTVKEFMN